MYCESISVTNLRCFREAVVRFRHPGEDVVRPGRLANITLLLGNNGAGKSTILRAVALAALAPVIQNSGYVPFSIIRRTQQGQATGAAIEAELRLHRQDVGNGNSGSDGRTHTRVQFKKRKDLETLEVEDLDRPYWERMFDESSSAFLLLGYGATRRVEDSDNLDLGARRKSRILRYQRVSGLFEEHITLMPLPFWLPRDKEDNPGRYVQVVNLLNRLLPEGTRFTGRLDGANYLFEQSRVKVPFSAMSDGFRAYIGWVADLLYHVCKGCPSGKKLVDNRGIVLVDEIDLHLHPDWQRSVIPTLSAALPNLQFVLSTHSPVVVGTLHRENVVVLGQTGKGTRATQLETEVHGLNADQILTSAAFGLHSSRAQSFLEQMKAVSKRIQAGERQAEEQFSKMLLYGAGGPESAVSAEETPRAVVEAARELKRRSRASRSRTASARGCGSGRKR